MTPVQQQQLKQAAMRALHAPGGPLSAEGTVGRNALLEMALVFDASLSEKAAREAGRDIISALKRADEIFRNVRCNLVIWHSDARITHQVVAAPVVQMGRCFDGWQQVREEKRLDMLMADLKKFEARCRLLVLVTDGGYRVGDAQALRSALNPFLYRRTVLLEGERVAEGRSLLSRI